MPGILDCALRAVRPLREIVRAARDWLFRYWRPAWSLEGVERHSGQPLRMLFVGQLENKNYFADLLFAGPVAERSEGRAWLWKALRLVKSGRTPHDLVIIDTDVPKYRRLLSRSAFPLPCWVRGEIDLAAVEAQIRKSSSIKSDLSKIKRNGYDYVVTRDERDFDRFYREVYLPYARRIYGGMTFLMPYSDLKQFIPHSELLWVRQDGEAVSGIMLRNDEGVMRAYALGVKGGDGMLAKNGALAALYCFAIDYLRTQGWQRLHLGGSRPFLRDGVLQYKRKWGMKIVGHSPSWFVVAAVRCTAAVNTFLVNNPCFVEREGALRGAVFVPEGTPLAESLVERPRREFNALGVSPVEVWQLPLGSGRVAPECTVLDGPVAHVLDSEPRVGDPRPEQLPAGACQTDASSASSRISGRVGA